MSVHRFDHPWVDETEFPVLQLAFPDPPPEREYEAFLEQLEAWVATSTGPYAWVIRPFVGTARQRKMMADSQKRRAPREAKHNACLAFVVQNALVRGALTAIFWLDPPPVPHEVFGDKASALAWAKQMLRASYGSHATR